MVNMIRKYLFMPAILFLFLDCPHLSARVYTIYPIPQSVTESSQTITLTSEITVIYESGIDETVRNRAEEVFTAAGYRLTESSAPSERTSNLYVGCYGSGEAADTYLTEHDLPSAVFAEAPYKYDPYLLQVNANSIHGDIFVAGNDEGSAFYAFATLEQMLEQAVGSSLQAVTVEDYSYTRYRGIVEGFYGYPYSVENRISLFKFCKRFKLNLFVYGPKSDPYHLGKWRDDYPVSLTDEERKYGMITQDDLRLMAAEARACGVDFVWAIHPAMQNGISFSSETAMESGLEAIMNKFRHMHDLGIRGFGVFIDDLNYTPSGSMQGYLADQVQKRLRAAFNGSQDKSGHVSPLFFVPTAYALNYGGSYTLSDLQSVDSEVVIAFTGYDCFSNLRPASIADMKSRVGRDPLFWWNNPVNDDHDDRLYMRKMTTHWTIESPYGPIDGLHGIIMNPMNQGQASKVILFGAADYCWNPADFDADANWEASFNHIANGDADMAEALECFARNSDALVEDDDMVSLYHGFMETFQPDKLPDETSALRAEMAALRDACIYLEECRDAGENDFRLMYEDIRCWNSKLKAMSSIVVDALDMLEQNSGMSRADAWEKYMHMYGLYDGLATDSAYIVSALEGQGTDLHEAFYAVAPADTYLRPFVDFVVEKVGNNIPGQWPEPDTAQVMTNLPDSGMLALSAGLESIALTGLQQAQFVPGGYAGIYLGRLERIGVEADLPAGIVLEISQNGKEWKEVVLPVDGQIAAYVRLINRSGSVLMPNSDDLVVDKVVTTVDLQPMASTNMETYLLNSVDLVTDGNVDTYFWKNGSQAIGDYILLDYSMPVPQRDISITFCSADRPTGTVAIEVSLDGNYWHEITSFTADDLDQTYSFTCDAQGYNAQYVRAILRSASGSEWLKVAEFSSNAQEAVAPTINQDGAFISTLWDKNMSTSYQATGAGYIEHQFIENMLVKSIEIFHYTQFNEAAGLPEIFVRTGNVWSPAGHLDKLCTIIDTQDMDSVTAVKVEWNAQNVPELYEILAFGYPPKADENLGTDLSGHANRAKIYYKNGHVHICSEKPMFFVSVFDIHGQLLIQENFAGQCMASVPIAGNSAMFVVNVIWQDGIQKAFKLLPVWE